MVMPRNWLITGGTGYLGRALTADLLRTGEVERVCIFSRGEHTQAQMRREFNDDERLRWLIGDVRDCGRLTMAAQRCDVVVHAAALKRVEVGEYNPTEMVSTNIDGTRNALHAALHSDRCQHFVLVSSDKACAPLNAYGATKLVAEKMTLGAGQYADPDGGAKQFAVARYGNVAGSTGSVIPAWREAIARKVRPYMTNPQCTRFWIGRQQAVDLLRWIIDCGISGTVVPDLSSYQLSDLAEAMDVSPRYMPLGREEKMHEDMIAACEAPGFSLMAPYFVRDVDRPPSSVSKGLNSFEAERLTVPELRRLLEGVA